MISSAIDKVKNVWNSFDLKKVSQSIEGTSSEAIQALFFFVSAFFIGFVFKKYFKLLFSCLFFTVLSIKVLEYNQLIIIDWAAIKIFLGIDVNIGVHVFCTNCFDWIKHNVMASISAIIGFIIGYKLG
jgi:uncharacterized membrane protein (Fun14 family)